MDVSFWGVLQLPHRRRRPWWKPRPRFPHGAAYGSVTRRAQVVPAPRRVRVASSGNDIAGAVLDTERGDKAPHSVSELARETLSLGLGRGATSGSTADGPVTSQGYSIRPARSTTARRSAASTAPPPKPIGRTRASAVRRLDHPITPLRPGGTLHEAREKCSSRD